MNTHCVSDGMDRPIAFPYSKKCLGLGKTFLNARTILSTAPESHRSWRWMMAISPQVNSHQQQFGSGSISFGTERVTGSNSRGFKKLGVGSAWLPAPLAGAAVPQLSSFPSRSSGSGCDSHGLSQTSLRNLPNSLQRPAGLPAGDACKLHRKKWEVPLTAVKRHSETSATLMPGCFPDSWLKATAGSI